MIDIVIGVIIITFVAVCLCVGTYLCKSRGLDAIEIMV
jgi:hypothetical protein